jgi:bifunctional N-acetylglucosamine-1-phosphate-uridyltransferase/glucosamine-1-phosphate-acetyltransferase GlmU-like protein
MKTVILCGGKGTRIRGTVADAPKPLLDIAGRPLVHRLMDHFSECNYKSFVLCLGHRGDEIRDYFDNRVIIVDEIHNMRMVNDITLGKKVPKIFHYVLDKLSNNVLVLLSATPMFNDYKEIRFILNTLLINNKSTLFATDIMILLQTFEKNRYLHRLFLHENEKTLPEPRGWIRKE